MFGSCREQGKIFIYKVTAWSEIPLIFNILNMRYNFNCLLKLIYFCFIKYWASTIKEIRVYNNSLNIDTNNLADYWCLRILVKYKKIKNSILFATAKSIKEEKRKKSKLINLKSRLIYKNKLGCKKNLAWIIIWKVSKKIQE